MNVKENIREFVINDQLGNALEFLNKLRIEGFDDEIIHHFASYNEIKSAERIGILKHEDISTKKAVLRNGILNLASEIEIHRSKVNVENQNSYELLQGHQVNSETLFGTKSNPRLGYNNDFYLKRDYLDKELRTSILFNQNILLRGRAGSGKSRALLYLIEKYLTKYSIVLPKIDSSNFSEFESIKNSEKTIIIYDDINLFFEQNYDIHFQFIQQMIDSKKLSIIATCRNSEHKIIKEKLGNLFMLFKDVEIKPLNSDDKKEVSESLSINKNEQMQIDENIGSYFEK